MYGRATRQRALALLATGLSLSEVSRRTGVSPASLRSWRDQQALQGDEPDPRGNCPRCDGADLAIPSYPALLGYYLGDGCVSRHPRYYSLRISCDEAWPGIVADVSGLIGEQRLGQRVHLVRAEGTIVVQGNWQHWPCLFPQHGPGRKHERPIVLEDWQRQVVEAHPGPFLRGLFHSDGCRVRNWTRRPVAGELKRYDYPRWQFTNHSADIRELCCWALDLAGVAWRQANWKSLSVARREAVARLDELIGPKR